MRHPDARHADILADSLTRQAREAAARLRGIEARGAGTLSRIDALTARRRTLEAELARDGDRLAAMLPVMLRLSLYPAETLLASPAAPTDTLGALMVLCGLGADLEADAARVRAERRALDRLAVSLRTESRSLAALGQTQMAADARIEAQVRSAAALQRLSGDDAAARASAAGAAAAPTLRGAISRLDAARLQRRRTGATAQARPASAPHSHGAEQALVVGRLVQGWGARTDAGPATGLTYAPPALALVAAPCDGQVDFAGPFRSYGHLLILDCGHGLRFVLAGMEQLDVAVGQRLKQGTPVGRMPNWSVTQTTGRPSLYVQLRRGSEAIDPTGFLHGRT